MINNLLKQIYVLFFNFKEKIHHHHLTRNEINLVKNTNLFNALSSKQFNEMLKILEFVKFPPDTLIVKEGELGDALYIIVEGSVRIFTYHLQDVKIPLARLNEGDYFGEQAFLGELNQSRNANIETITDTTLIKVNEKFITHLFKSDFKLKVKLQKLGCEQALNVLSLPTEFYNEMKSIISQIEAPTILDLKKDTVIFHQNDNADNAYFILQGEVLLTFSEKQKIKTNQLILHKGHIFGELGVLLNKPRAATATVYKHTRLLVLPGHFLKKQVALTPRLLEILSILQKTYQFPTVGIVEQYIGNVLDMGTTITNIFKRDNGQSIISSQSIYQNVFMMSIVDVPVEESYLHKHADRQIELGTYKNRLCRIKSYGSWDDLPNICYFLLNNRVINEDKLIQFEKTGELKLETRTEVSRKIICPCMSISKKHIHDCINQGLKTLDQLIEATGVCTVCGGCAPRILEMLGETPWISATIERIDSYGSDISNFLIKPKDKKFISFIPGQHIIIQTKIEDDWVERPYTISGMYDGNLRITIKKMPDGLFTKWLFKKANTPIKVNILPPQGSFQFNIDENTDAICFAGGVGIAPFITFIKALAEKKSIKRVHILFSALKSDDFILKDEFDELAKQLPTFTISYQATGIRNENMLVNSEIIKLIHSFNHPDIYICGSLKFTNFIHNAIKEMNYDPSKIHIERFVQAFSIVSDFD